MGLVGLPFSPWPSCWCWWCWWCWWRCSWPCGSLLLFGTWSFSSVLLAPDMEPQGSLRTSVVPGTRASPPHSCRTLRQVARGLPRTDTHKGCLPVFSPDASRRLGHFREPDRPEGDGSWTCTRSSLPPEGLPRSSPCSAGCERSVRRLQAASLTRGQRCGQGTETGNERQTHTQSPIPRGLSHPRRSGRPSDRAQARSCTPSPHPLQRLPSRASPRELSRSGTSPSQVNTETPGTLQAPLFPRRLHHAHGREELAPRRNSRCVTQGVPHTACAWASARMCVRADLPPQPQRRPRLLVLPLGGSGPPAGTRAVADVLRPRRRGVRAGTVEPLVLLLGRRAVSPSSVFGLVNHDCAGRQGRLDLPQLQGRLRSAVFLQASPLL